MTEHFSEKLPQSNGSGSLKIWLQADAYSKRILLGHSQANPWESVSGYVTWFSQAQNLTKSTIGVISIAEVFENIIKQHGGLENQMGNRRKPKMAIRRLIELEDARVLINEVFTAVIAQASKPILLRIPSPKTWLFQATQLAGLDITDISTDDIEDSAVYIADLCRALSSQQISGILLEERKDDRQWSEEIIRCYQPLLNVAAHYRWPVLLRIPENASISDMYSGKFNAVIGNLHASQQTSIGVDVSTQFNEGEDLPQLNSGEFYFIEIDENSLPEETTEKIDAIQR